MRHNAALISSLRVPYSTLDQPVIIEYTNLQINIDLGIVYLKRLTIGVIVHVNVKY